MSTHYKIEDLWLCALSCFAACDWDLSLLIKKSVGERDWLGFDLFNTNSSRLSLFSSNAIRVGALLSRLIRWAFESDLSSQSRTLFAEEPFKFLNSFDRVGASRLFSGWLYARWVLKTDLDGRFPVCSFIYFVLTHFKGSSRTANSQQPVSFKSSLTNMKIR